MRLPFCFRWHKPVLNQICDIIGIFQSSTKETQVNSILEFCLKPDESVVVKKLPKTPKGKRRSSSSKSKKRSPKKDSKKTQKTKAKKKGKKTQSSEDEHAEGSGDEEVIPGSSNEDSPPQATSSRSVPSRSASLGKKYKVVLKIVPYLKLKPTFSLCH